MAGLQTVFELHHRGEGRFEGAAPREGGTRVYGGYTFAQALLSALRTLGAEWSCYVADARFLKAGVPAQPIEHVVESTSVGRAFATQRIVSMQQNARPIMIMTASFQKPESGPDFQASPAPTAPSPHLFEPERERYKRMISKLPAGLDIELIPSDIYGRWTDPQDLEAPTVKSASRHVWLRSTDTVDDDPQSRQVALAYCSDFSFIETSLRPFGVS